MHDMPCMHFVYPNCYEGGDVEEFMGFSLPKRFSVVNSKGLILVSLTLYFFDLNGFNFVLCRKCQHTLFMVFYSGLSKSRSEDNSNQFEINT